MTATNDHGLVHQFRSITLLDRGVKRIAIQMAD
jgi:hypothetical protein